MFVTSSSIQKGEPCRLPRLIDNSDETLKVAVRSFVYHVGWYNARRPEWVYWKWGESAKLSKLVTEPGLYSFQTLRQILEKRIRDFSMGLEKQMAQLRLLYLKGSRSSSTKFAPSCLVLIM